MVPPSAIDSTILVERDLSFAHLGDALATWVVARKGLIPRRCAWGRGRN
jgi:hypothetical protein